MSWNYLIWHAVPDKQHSSNNQLTRILKVVPNTPFCVFIGNQSISELEQTLHNLETIDFLNLEGLDIYLIEPICSYLDNNKYRFTFYDEFIAEEALTNIKSKEFDSILKYVLQNNLKKVTVHTGDYRADKFYDIYKSHFKIICDDLFLKTCYETGYEKEFLNPVFDKKFINLNWRYTKHRHLVAGYLTNFSCRLSWYYKMLPQHIFNNVYFSIENFKEEFPVQFNNLKIGLDTLYNNSPYNVDLNIDTATLVDENFFVLYPKNEQYISTPNNDSWRNHLIPFYRECFCDVITETRFAQPTGNFSEKVYQSIFFLKPFILVAPPYTLEYIRSQGFKTFENFWDETYDTEEDHGRRLGKIFGTIDYINSFTINQLKEMYVNMKEILEYNQKLLLSKIPEYYQTS